MALTLASLLPYIAPDVKKCPEPIIIQNLRLGINEFLRDTQLWQRDMTAINVVANQTSYALPSTPANSEVEQVVGAKFDGEDMVPGSHYEMTDELTLKLLFTPPTAITGGIVVRAAHRLAPGMDAPTTGTITDAVLERIVSSWLTAIVEKTKAILCFMRDKPWSDEKAAGTHEFLYTGFKNKAVIAKLQKHTNAELQITYRRFC